MCVICVQYLGCKSLCLESVSGCCTDKSRKVKALDVLLVTGQNGLQEAAPPRSLCCRNSPFCCPAGSGLYGGGMQWCPQYSGWDITQSVEGQ